MPLTRHGSGTQSLAVLFLFEAFFATMLTQQYDVLSRPILALEEPESHLHPCAVRSLWVSLCAIAGQKIIATHSGDLLARVPLTAIRRFCRQNGKVRVCSVRPGLLTPEEEKRIDFHLQSCRGELLFARCWFLGEGESEYWVFGEAADILGYDLDRLGVRFVNTRYSGVEILVKVANETRVSVGVLSEMATFRGKATEQSARNTCKDGIRQSLFVSFLGPISKFYCASQASATFTRSTYHPKKKGRSQPKRVPLTIGFKLCLHSPTKTSQRAFGRSWPKCVSVGLGLFLLSSNR